VAFDISGKLILAGPGNPSRGIGATLGDTLSPWTAETGVMLADELNPTNM
jgi:hypothetical protein